MGVEITNESYAIICTHLFYSKKKHLYVQAYPTSVILNNITNSIDAAANYDTIHTCNLRFVKLYYFAISLLSPSKTIQYRLF